MYVLDTSVISALHRNYYRSQFVTLWERFDGLVEEGRFTSTLEAFRELEDLGGDAFDWADAHKELFCTPDAKEGAMVARIYAVRHFQANMEKQKIIKGGRNADPFLIARAASLGATLVTMEQLKPHGAKIPNICDHFRVKWLDLRGFMKQENWVF
jgi:predicted nucleic acid-binding protein